MENLICNNDLMLHIRANLERFRTRTDSRPDLIPAAVAITIVDVRHDPAINDMTFDQSRAKDAAIVLTRRASTLKNHAGQWALPGGRLECGESPEAAALRELEEEIGLKLHAGQVISRLDDYCTRSGFAITPVVVWAGTGAALTPNPEEVASIHRIPLAEFMRADAPILESIPESDHPVLLMPVGNSWIASPTAAILYQFREVAVLGHTTRVSHYEQPYFAWR